MIEKASAAVVLLLCIVLMVRLLLSASRRARFDAAVRRTWLRSRHGALSLYHWRDRRRTAERAAEEAIRRARGARSGDPAEGEWEGNVYKPKSFRKPRKLH